jgi:hypothetical protein
MLTRETLGKLINKHLSSGALDWSIFDCAADCLRHYRQPRSLHFKFHSFYINLPPGSLNLQNRLKLINITINFLSDHNIYTMRLIDQLLLRLYPREEYPTLGQVVNQFASQHSFSPADPRIFMKTRTPILGEPPRKRSGKRNRLFTNHSRISSLCSISEKQQGLATITEANFQRFISAWNDYSNEQFDGLEEHQVGCKALLIITFDLIKHVARNFSTNHLKLFLYIESFLAEKNVASHIQTVLQNTFVFLTYLQLTHDPACKSKSRSHAEIPETAALSILHESWEVLGGALDLSISRVNATLVKPDQHCIIPINC